jgi:hypothetical protein
VREVAVKVVEAGSQRKIRNTVHFNGIVYCYISEERDALLNENDNWITSDSELIQSFKFSNGPFLTYITYYFFQRQELSVYLA